jgi:hypothetical protein
MEFIAEKYQDESGNFIVRIKTGVINTSLLTFDHDPTEEEVVIEVNKLFPEE